MTWFVVAALIGMFALVVAFLWGCLKGFPKESEIEFADTIVQTVETRVLDRRVHVLIAVAKNRELQGTRIERRKAPVFVSPVLPIGCDILEMDGDVLSGFEEVLSEELLGVNLDAYDISDEKCLWALMS
jgi:hypothetical protein